MSDLCFALANKDDVKKKILNKWSNSCNINDLCTSHVIHDLISHRDGLLHMPFSQPESSELLTELCCN